MLVGSSFIPVAGTISIHDVRVLQENDFCRCSGKLWHWQFRTMNLFMESGHLVNENQRRLFLLAVELDKSLTT